MAIGSVIPDDTIRAYEKAHYDVLGDAPFTLRIGARSDALSDLYMRNQVASVAFLTAENPFGVLTNSITNACCQDRLVREIIKGKLIFMNGVGRDPLDEWPGETSLLILGIARETATRLGVRYRQNAIVWSGANAIPELVLLR